jgi:uncharacterized protein YjbJ (UPF0337 family)
MAAKSEMIQQRFLRGACRSSNHEHIRRISMGSTADKIAGMTNKAVGKAKQGAGRVLGSDKLRVKGAAQEAKGDAQKAVGSAKAAAKDAANKTSAFVNKKR